MWVNTFISVGVGVLDGPFKKDKTVRCGMSGTPSPTVKNYVYLPPFRPSVGTQKHKKAVGVGALDDPDSLHGLNLCFMCTEAVHSYRLSLGVCASRNPPPSAEGGEMQEKLKMTPASSISENCTLAKSFLLLASLSRGRWQERSDRR